MPTSSTTPRESPKSRRRRRGSSDRSRLHRHGGRKFGRNQRHGNTPEERQNQHVDQSHARPRSRDHVFQTERSARGVGEHHEDEVEESGFAEGGLVLRRRMRIGYGTFDMSPPL